MADAELKVRIDAEIGEGIKKADGTFIDFGRSIAQLETKLKSFQAGLKNATNPESIARLNRAIDATKGKINDISKFNQAGGASLQKFSSGSDQAAFALTNLGRVAQDAPFGFIGIQNNIQPLIESFQRLKNESGSTGGALKALGQSLVGGGGLLLAVSVVTSALTVLAQNPEAVSGALNSLSGAVDNATETQKRYNAELIESVAAANTEIKKVESLISIAKDETLSRNARLQALQKVKAEYPEQLKFLDLENINSRKAAAAIDVLTNSLLRKAKIQAAEKLIGEAFVKQLEATTKSTVEQASVLSKVVGAGLSLAGIKNFVVLQNGLENQEKAFKSAGEEINTYDRVLKKLLAEDAKAETLFNSKAGSALNQGLGSSDEAFKREKAISIQRQNSLDTFLAKYRATEAELNKTPLIGLPTDFNTRLIEPVQSFSDYLKGDILPQLGSSFKTFFDEILIRGNLSFAALGKSILATFASVLASEATQGVISLLSGGSQVAGRKGGGLFKAIGGLFGAGATAAGSGGTAAAGTAATGGLLLPILGGIAAGALLTSLFKKKTPAPQPAYSTSSASTSSASAVDFGGGRVVFEISGVNLVGVLNRAGAKLQRFGP